MPSGSEQQAVGCSCAVLLLSPVRAALLLGIIRHHPPYLTTWMLEMAHTGVWGEVGAHTELFCSAVRCHHSERASPEAPAGPGAAEHHE